METKQRDSVAVDLDVKMEDTTIVSHDAITAGGKDQSKLCQLSKKLKSVVSNSEINRTKSIVVKSEKINDSGKLVTKNKKLGLRSIVAEEMTGIKDEISQPKTKRRRVLASSTLNTHRVMKEKSSDSPFSPIFTKTRSFKRSLPTSSLVTQQASVLHNTRSSELVCTIVHLAPFLPKLYEPFYMRLFKHLK